MIVGACGVSCDVCRLHVCGVCPGCVSGDRYNPLKAAELACPILECAMAKGVGYCTRDCPEYPCALCSSGLPICSRNSLMAVQVPLDETPSAWAKLGLRWTSTDPAARSAARSAELHILCLGPLRVYRGGKKITDTDWGQGKGPAQKVKALFAYLMAKGNPGATKDEVIELLWRGQGNNPRVQARFHATIYYLRRALEPGLRSRESSRFVVFEDGRYRLTTPGGTWVDAQALEAYYRNALQLEVAGQEELAARNWKLAEALYQGEYMAGISPRYTETYEGDWCQLERYRLAAMYSTILLKLAGYHWGRGEDRQSLFYAHRNLELFPENEQAHRFAMRLHHRAGRWPDLLRQYQTCERQLRQAEDREPEPDTRRLFLRLSESMPAAGLRATDATIPP